MPRSVRHDIERYHNTTKMWFLEVIQHLTFRDTTNLLFTSRLYYQVIVHLKKSRSFWGKLRAPPEMLDPYTGRVVYLEDLEDYEYIHALLNYRPSTRTGRGRYFLGLDPARRERCEPIIRKLVARKAIRYETCMSIVAGSGVYLGVPLEELIDSFASLPQIPVSLVDAVIISKDVKLFRKAWYTYPTSTQRLCWHPGIAYYIPYVAELQNYENILTIFGTGLKTVAEITPEIREVMRSYTPAYNAHLLSNLFNRLEGEPIDMLEGLLAEYSIKDDALGLSSVIRGLVSRYYNKSTGEIPSQQFISFLNKLASLAITAYKARLHGLLGKDASSVTALSVDRETILGLNTATRKTIRKALHKVGLPSTDPRSESNEVLTVLLDYKNFKPP